MDGNNKISTQKQTDSESALPENLANCLQICLDQITYYQQQLEQAESFYLQLLEQERFYERLRATGQFIDPSAATSSA